VKLPFKEVLPYSARRTRRSEILERLFIGSIRTNAIRRSVEGGQWSANIFVDQSFCHEIQNSYSNHFYTPSTLDCNRRLQYMHLHEDTLTLEETDLVSAASIEPEERNVHRLTVYSREESESFYFGFWSKSEGRSLELRSNPCPPIL